MNCNHLRPSRPCVHAIVAACAGIGSGRYWNRRCLEGQGQDGHHGGSDHHGRGLNGRRGVDTQAKGRDGQFLLGVEARVAIRGPEVVRGVDGHTVDATHKVTAWASEGGGGVDSGLRLQRKRWG
jgi:hypothetical protein